MINNLKSLCWDLKNLYFPKRHPFGKKPVASKEFYLSKLNQIKIKNYENVNLYEQEVNFKVDNNWLNNLALHTQIVKKKVKLTISMVDCFIHVLEIIFTKIIWNL